MGFAFSQRSKVARQVRKNAAEQIEAALEESRAGGDFDETVHKLRRRCKKIRGLLLLVRPNFRDFDSENAAFRDAADALSTARDAAVVLETLNTLAEQGAFQAVAPETLERSRKALEDNAHRVFAEQDRAALLIGFGDAMVAALPRVERWTFKARGFALLRPGLRNTYARLCQRMKTAEKTGHDEAFHDWRKATKGHWFHVGLLKDCAPDILGAHRDQLDILGEYLGDRHNLAVLAERLIALAGPLDGALAKAFDDHKTILAGKAFALGRQLTVENPSALVSRFEKFWTLLPKDT